MTNNTRDLSKFGYREYDMAGDLLKALANPSNHTQVEGLELSDGVTIEFNPNSGNVFLIDEDNNTVMMNQGKKLENWVQCYFCGNEDFKSKININNDSLCADCVAKGNS